MRKILIVILFAAVAAFADHVLPKMSLYLLDVGYSSLGRIELDVAEFRVGDQNQISITPLRFDFRISYDDGEYDLPPISLGAPIVGGSSLGIGILMMAKDLSHIAGPLLVTSYLASGNFHYSFLEFKYADFSVFESHVFEWWLYKKNDKWHMDEAGWGQELGLEIYTPYASLDGGAQFEITNKRKGIGWFARINLVEILALQEMFH